MAEENGEEVNIFEEVWRESQAAKQEAAKPKTFKPLPDGRYLGVLTISVGTVKEGENQGRKKLLFTLAVCQGKEKGKTAYYNHVLFPQNLARKPAGMSDEKYREAVAQHNRKTEKYLEICGVDVKAGSINELVARAPQQANGNKIWFTVKTENNRRKIFFDALAEAHDNSHAGLFLDFPDGEDAPFGVAQQS